MPLTEGENWLRTVRMTNPDRMPYQIALLSPTWAALGRELEDVVLRHPRTWPGFERGSYDWKNIQHPPSQDPSQDFVDLWGSVWRTTRPGDVGVVVKPALQDQGDLDSFDPPDSSTYNGGIHPVDWDATRKRLAAVRAKGGLPRGGLDHGYHLLRLEYLRGFENLMCDMMDDTPVFRRLVEAVHQLNRTAVKNWIDAGARVISLPEDLGSQTGSLTGPRMFRKWVTPYHRELHDMAHDAGCLTDFHCDGNIMDVADQILEIGPDAFNPQDMANGVDNLAEAFKGKLCIRLDFDRQHAIPFSTPREIRELVEYEVRTLGSPEGGLMMRAGVRGDNIPPENIDALASALEDLCTYWFD